MANVKFYHVWVDGVNEKEIVTPSYNDAYAEFYRLIHVHPTEIINFDEIEGNNTMEDIMSGVFEGKRVRVMQCDPI